MPHPFQSLCIPSPFVPGHKLSMLKNIPGMPAGKLSMPGGKLSMPGGKLSMLGGKLSMLGNIPSMLKNAAGLLSRFANPADFQPLTT